MDLEKAKKMFAGWAVSNAQLEEGYLNATADEAAEHVWKHVPRVGEVLWISAGSDEYYGLIARVNEACVTVVFNVAVPFDLWCTSEPAEWSEEDSCWRARIAEIGDIVAVIDTDGTTVLKIVKDTYWDEQQFVKFEDDEQECTTNMAWSEVDRRWEVPSREAL